MRTNAIVAGLALTLGLAACDSSSGLNPIDGAGDGTARVAVLLTDAPAELSEASVQIRKIYAMRAGAEADSVRSDSAGGGKVVLFSGDRTFDLLKLQNGLTAELANVTIPAGTYSQLRLVLGDVTLKTKSGTTYRTADGSLKCPSCAQSGLKVNLANGGVKLDGTQKLVLDFDVNQSFGHEAGKSGKWIMHPVINATNLTSTGSTTGSIAGKVSLGTGVTLPACGGSATSVSLFTPTAKSATQTLTAKPDSTGAFRFQNVTVGSYAMAYQDSVTFDNGNRLRFTADAAPATAAVAAGQTATVNYTVKSATCATS